MCYILVSQEDGIWTLKFDNITVRREVTAKNDISLIDKDVYIGGRPGKEVIILGIGFV